MASIISAWRLSSYSCWLAGNCCSCSFSGSFRPRFLICSCSIWNGKFPSSTVGAALLPAGGEWMICQLTASTSDWTLGMMKLGMMKLVMKSHSIMWGILFHLKRKDQRNSILWLQMCRAIGLCLRIILLVFRHCRKRFDCSVQCWVENYKHLTSWYKIHQWQLDIARCRLWDKWDIVSSVASPTVFIILIIDHQLSFLGSVKIR